MASMTHVNLWLFFATLFVFVWVAAWTKYKNAVREREERRRPEVLKISIAPKYCSFCDTPLKDGDVVVRWSDSLGAHLAHVECTPKPVLDEVTLRAP